VAQAEPLYRIEREPEVDGAVLVMGLDGWIDAGLGAAAAVAALLEQIPTEVVATFDADELVDHRARRPVMRIQDGVNTGLTWPDIHLRHGLDREGHDVLFLVGPEPDMRWHRFTADVVALARRFNTRLAVGLGAFPGPASHTRPVRLASTATTPELAAKVGFLPGVIDVPAGIHAALERAFTETTDDGAGPIPAVGIWARVPHYVSAMPYPAASAALLDGLHEVAGIAVRSDDLRAAAALTSERIDTLVANSDEHRNMVAQLERQDDEAEAQMELRNLPTGDEIAAELERFLREEG
jgi:predicted ATP-grasp superfamily ATP-dependent carboligase